MKKRDLSFDGLLCHDVAMLLNGSIIFRKVVPVTFTLKIATIPIGDIDTGAEQTPVFFSSFQLSII